NGWSEPKNDAQQRILDMQNHVNIHYDKLSQSTKRQPVNVHYDKLSQSYIVSETNESETNTHTASAPDHTPAQHAHAPIREHVDAIVQAHVDASIGVPPLPPMQSSIPKTNANTPKRVAVTIPKKQTAPV